MMRRALVAAVVLVGVASSAAAWALSPDRTLTQYVLDVWQVEQGLPQSSVWDIVASGSGYLWLTTDEGLARFDGNRFKTFDLRNTPALGTRAVSTLFEAKDGTLWIGTWGAGLVSYKDGVFTPQAAAAKLDNVEINDLTPDPYGVVWAATSRHGVLRYERGAATAITTAEGLSTNSITKVWVDRAGRLWVGTEDDGVAQIALGERSATLQATFLPGAPITAFFEAPQGDLLVGTRGRGLWRIGADVATVEETQPPAPVTAMLIDKDGRFFVATDGAGVCRLEGNRYVCLGVDDGLSSMRIASLCEDQAGSLWVGTKDAGLARLREGRVVSYTTREGLAHNQARVVLAAADDSMWVGTLGGGISRFARGRVAGHFSRADGLPGLMVRALQQRRDGTIWIGTFDGGLAQYDGRRFTAVTKPAALALVQASSFAEDERRTLWIGTYFNGLFETDGQVVKHWGAAEGLSSDRIRVLLAGAGGALWIGTHGGGLDRLQAGKVEAVDLGADVLHPIVYALFEDQEGALWVGTGGAGLLRRTPSQLARVTTADGLVSNTIYQILEDESRDLWMCSSRGIFKVRRAELEAFFAGRLSQVHADVFGRSDGVQSSQCGGGSQPAGAVDGAGRVWFPTSNGVIVVDPAATKAPRASPTVVIERVAADGVDYSAAAVGELAAGTRDLELQYTALGLAAPEKARFRHRLEGFDHDWVDAAGGRTARYTNLDSGAYLFEVALQDDTGAPSATRAQVAFSVRPQLHERRAFQILLAACLLALGVAGYRTRLRALQHADRVLARLVEEQTRSSYEETRRAEAARATIEAQSEQLREIERRKMSFFARVSNEFRTPLTLIMGPLEGILADRFNTAEEREQLYIILRNSRRLLRLINQFLDLSKIEQAQMGLACRAVQLDEFLKGVIESFLPFARRKSIELKLYVEGELGPVYADPEKMEKVFFNILSNAVKFTPVGGKVAVILRDRDAQVEALVRDSGQGIPTADLPKILTPFALVDAAEGGDHEGTGIGLSLAQQIVLMHGGSIGIDSVAGVGTDVKVSLKKGTAHLRPQQLVADAATRDVADMPARAAVEMAGPRWEQEDVEPGPTGDGETVLVIDDERDVRRYLKSVLQEHYTVYLAADGLTGLERVKELMPHLVISDLRMPNLDGLELVQALRDMPVARHIPVLILSAHTSEESRLELLNRGADDYLAKPFGCEELLLRVQNLLSARRQERELFGAARALEEKIKSQGVALERGQRFAQYVAAGVLEQAAATDSSWQLATERRAITVVCTDLRGFTALTDSIEPELIERILNAYLAAMIRQIDHHGGTLDRIMGDGMTVLFGAPWQMAPEAQCEQAVRMAVAMQQDLRALGAEWLEEGLDHSIELRIGIHHGQATVGNFGTPEQMAYAAIGTSVSLARLLETTCTPGRVQISRSVAALLQNTYPLTPAVERDFGPGLGNLEAIEVVS
ncbi:MAG: response regulator [Deltaproteobacteria bacterium]|nr:response regulator [Deltaproteobacteria bacterium]